MLQWSNYAFDGSVYEIYCSLLKGASLHLIKDDWASDVHELSKVIKDQNLTVCFLTTALFNTFADIDPAALQRLRKILFGGEKVSPAHVQKTLSAVGADKIVHVYGPTETTVYATYYPVNNIGEDGLIPIGKPLANTKLFVLDKDQQLVPIGVPGELYIGGEGVSLGYLNRAELTREKFIMDPFYPGGRLYRTGDLAHWLPDGNIEYLGRMDDQVKIRGYRIEPGEIEDVLLQSELVSQAVVLSKEDDRGHKHLVGYVVPKAAGPFDKKAVMAGIPAAYHQR
jgi:amino acid adenylation domain-containing protein